MLKQENVCVETESAERGMKGVAAENGAVEGVGSAALGKFKDVNALLQAYQSLQAEFTRRSQRLKRLEQEAEKRGAASAEAEQTAETASEGEGSSPAATASCPDFGMEASVQTGAKTERENLEQDGSHSGGENTVNADMGGAFVQPSGEENALESNRTGDERAQNTETDLQESEALETRVSSQGASGQGSAATFYQNANDPDELYARASANESVRLRIVGDYLSSIQKGGAPLMRGGTQTAPIGRARAETIAEAGRRALTWLREKGRQK